MDPSSAFDKNISDNTSCSSTDNGCELYYCGFGFTYDCFFGEQEELMANPDALNWKSLMTVQSNENIGHNEQTCYMDPE